jgi:hypothetical protein
MVYVVFKYGVYFGSISGTVLIIVSRGKGLNLHGRDKTLDNRYATVYIR